MGGKEPGEGLVHVYTGDGKGKTTAALGLAMRACGHGFRVYMIQFMKGGWDYGELRVAEKLPNFTIRQFGRPTLVDKGKPSKIDVDLAREALSHAKEVVGSGKYDIVILDEVNVALEWKLIELSEVLEMIREKPRSVELVLTGRYAPRELVEVADLVTEMREVKHPYSRGILARKGLGY
ncbi:MAG: cob(I)yrinic acid a,c-diamide adenosyltransferase [Candidatus Geothermarchaeales archaeon]